MYQDALRPIVIIIDGRIIEAEGRLKVHPSIENYRALGTRKM